MHQTCLSKNSPAHGTALNLIIQIPTQSFDEEQPNSSSKDITSTNLFEPRATSSSSTDVIGSPENTGSNAYRKLYEGSLMTVESSCITINKFIHKHHLSKQAQEDLLIKPPTTAPSHSKLASTFVVLLSASGQFWKVSHQIVPLLPKMFCSNPSCGAEVGTNYFIVLPICSQLRKLLSSMYIYTTDGADVWILYTTYNAHLPL